MIPIWKYVPAEIAHKIAPLGLSFYSAVCGGETPRWQSFEWRGLSFANRLGLAGGMDKNGEHLVAWQKLGAGFLEVGTITPKPQKANPGKILDRDWTAKTLWNKMGFPNFGAEDVYFNLLHQKNEIHLPLFVNISKNRDTSQDEALKDYQILAQRFAPLASAFVMNVSSPNTVGLRDLQSKEELSRLVKNVKIVLNDLGKQTPIVVKLSPDLSEEQLKNAIDSSLEAGADGITLTNTTQYRPEGCSFPKEGGLSGGALRELSLRSLELTAKNLGGKNKSHLLISVGGVMTTEDVEERLSLGADLVQVYSVLVFEGPRFFRQAADHFRKQRSLQ